VISFKYGPYIGFTLSYYTRVSLLGCGVNPKINGLQKAEYSDYCIFAEFGTHFFPSSVFCFFRIVSKSSNQNFTKIRKLTKQNILGPKMAIFLSKHLFLGLNPFLGQKPRFWGQKRGFRKFCMYGIFGIFCMYRIFGIYGIFGICYILYIQNISFQNRINIFAQNSFQLKF